jgi:hypothetical protein
MNCARACLTQEIIAAPPALNEIKGLPLRNFRTPGSPSRRLVTRNHPATRRMGTPSRDGFPIRNGIFHGFSPLFTRLVAFARIEALFLCA